MLFEMTLSCRSFISLLIRTVQVINAIYDWLKNEMNVLDTILQYVASCLLGWGMWVNLIHCIFCAGLNNRRMRPIDLSGEKFPRRWVLIIFFLLVRRKNCLDLWRTQRRIRLGANVDQRSLTEDGSADVKIVTREVCHECPTHSFRCQHRFPMISVDSRHDEDDRRCVWSECLNRMMEEIWSKSAMKWSKRVKRRRSSWQKWWKRSTKSMLRRQYCFIEQISSVPWWRRILSIEMPINGLSTHQREKNNWRKIPQRDAKNSIDQFQCNDLHGNLSWSRQNSIIVVQVQIPF